MLVWLDRIQQADYLCECHLNQALSGQLRLKLKLKLQLHLHKTTQSSLCVVAECGRLLIPACGQSSRLDLAAATCLRAIVGQIITQCRTSQLWRRTRFMRSPTGICILLARSSERNQQVVVVLVVGQVNWSARFGRIAEPVGWLRAPVTPQ